MATTLNIGTGAQQGADDLIQITVRPGETVTVKNNSGSTISYHSRGHSGGATGTVTATNSQSFTAAGTHYIASADNGGRSTITVSGGLYG